MNIENTNYESEDLHRRKKYRINIYRWWHYEGFNENEPENRRNVLAVPKVGGYYLVTYYGKYADFLPLVKESKYLNGNFSVENVIAWRELPLPYGGN